MHFHTYQQSITQHQYLHTAFSSIEESDLIAICLRRAIRFRFSIRDKAGILSQYSRPVF